MHPQAQPHAHHPHYPQQQGYPQQGYPQQGYPQGAVPTQPPVGVAGGQYEFGAEENRTISTTYGRMRAWGVISILLGGCQVWVALGSGGGVNVMEMFGAVGGLVSVIVGVVFLGSAAAFERVVKSQGNDVALMMTALGKLSTAFMILIIVAALSFVGGGVLGAIGKM